MTLHKPVQAVLIAACLLVWTGAFINNAPYPCVVWDDALMFVRYALHVTQGLGVAWNPDAIPTWGPTSLAYLLVVTPLQMLMDDATRAAGAASLVSGLCWVALLIALAFRVFPRSLGGRLLAISIALAVLSDMGNSLAMHLRSGMDTPFALAYLTGYIVLAHQVAHRPEQRRWSWWTGALGGVAPLVRPDLCIYVGVVPVVLALTANVQARRAALQVVGTTIVVAVITWLLAYAYFRTPLPLAFYVKGSGAVDPEFAQLYARIPQLQLAAYLELIAPLAIGTALVAALQWRATFRARLDWGLLIATVIFLLYYRFAVLQVMHYGQRFYFPTLPAFIYLAMSALQRLLDEPPLWFAKLSQHFTDTRLGSAVQRMGALRLPSLAPWVALLLATSVEFKRNDRIVKATVLCPVAPEQEQQATLRNAWPGINLLAALPNDLAIATTEVGRPGVMSPRRPIIDLSGLNDAQVARGAWSPVQATLAAKADVVYLHPDYKGMNRGFTENARFGSEYELFQPKGPRFLTVFVRRDSRYHAEIIDALSRD
ncbi:MAG TPA: hypothetical protein VHO25_05070 [Polyangiaceae bacterium]|nr:hypothetical protein [Polyangiaceae bacterium]